MGDTNECVCPVCCRRRQDGLVKASTHSERRDEESNLEKNKPDVTNNLYGEKRTTVEKLGDRYEEGNGSDGLRRGCPVRGPS